MANDRPSCYFFIKESFASEKEQDKIDNFEAVNIKVRNASLVGPSDRPEGDPDVDYVAGEVPEAYARAGYKDVSEKASKAASRKAALRSDGGESGKTAPAVATPSPAMNPLPPALAGGFLPGAGPTPAGEPVPASPANVSPLPVTDPDAATLPAAAVPPSRPEAPAPVTTPAPKVASQAWGGKP